MVDEIQYTGIPCSLVVLVLVAVALRWPPDPATTTRMTWRRMILRITTMMKQMTRHKNNCPNDYPLCFDAITKKCCNYSGRMKKYHRIWLPETNTMMALMTTLHVRVPFYQMERECWIMNISWIGMIVTMMVVTMIWNMWIITILIMATAVVVVVIIMATTAILPVVAGTPVVAFIRRYWYNRINVFQEKVDFVGTRPLSWVNISYIALWNNYCDYRYE